MPDKQWYGSFSDVFAEAALKWYDLHKRDLPWRDRNNPYYTWVSEVMLQQTRSQAVIPYFNRFIEELPDIRHLSVCPQDKMMKLWEGLGYYSRARNLQKAALRIMEEYRGSLPENSRELKKLPGIGPYTAGAIASIAFGEKVPAIDGNVLRVTARLTGSHEPVNSGSFRKKTEELLQQLIPADRPGDFNQALMDIGAMICRPNGQPSCPECPFRMICRAAAEDETSRIPVKTAGKKRKEVPLTVLVVQNGAGTLLQKRPEGGLLSGLYEFPTIEGFLEEKEVQSAVRGMGFVPLRIEALPDSSHCFTHIEWKMKAWRIRIAEASNEEHAGIFAGKNTAEKKYAIPSAFKEYAGYLKEDWT